MIFCEKHLSPIQFLNKNRCREGSFLHILPTDWKLYLADLNKFKQGLILLAVSEVFVRRWCIVERLVNRREGIPKDGKKGGGDKKPKTDVLADSLPRFHVEISENKKAHCETSDCTSEMRSHWSVGAVRFDMAVDTRRHIGTNEKN